MDLGTKLAAGIGILESRFLHINRPLVVNWETTFNCNLDCKYCGFSSLEKKDAINTDKGISLIKEMADAGTKMLTFTGGEPLLRKDIGVLVEEAKRNGIYTTMNTNGILLPKRMDEIKNVDMVQVSLDGPVSINDKVRGKGSYEKAVDGILISKMFDVDTIMMAIVSKANVDHMDSVMGLAEDLGVKVLFQPVSPYYKASDNVDEFIPTAPKFRKAVDSIMEWKRGSDCVVNSFSVLNEFKKWPDGVVKKCPAGILRCRMGADGKLYACGRCESKGVSLDDGLEKAFDSLTVPKCSGCWCSNNVQFSEIYSMNPRALWEALRY